MISIEDYQKLIAIHPEFVIHPLKGKIPVLIGWQKIDKTPADIEQYILNGYNIGLVCGSVSRTTAIDLDSMLFADEIFKNSDVSPKTSGRTAGRGHAFFKYTDKIKPSKHHDLGIEIMGNGNNLVIPPSIHPSGDVYKWKDINAPIPEMPDIVINNLNQLFKTESELKQALSKCRHCFRDLIKNHPNMHGADGRLYMLAICTDLKSKDGININHIKMFAKLIYGADYDEIRTIEEFNKIDSNKTWSCDKLRQNVPAYVDLEACERCRIRREEHKERRTDKKEPRKPEEPEEPEAPQHIKDKAIEILKEGKAIDFLINEYHHIHVGDTVTGKMILASIASQSVLNSSGLQPKLSAGSGKGKSHASKSILHLVPKKYVLETSLSGKALYYKEGLQAGTLIYSDDTEPDEELQATIKKSTTNFQAVTNREISVKIEGEWTTKKFSIPERIVWLLTSVNDTGSIEYLNRQFNLSVDESAQQDELVWKRLQERAITGEAEYPINDNVLICREIIQEIKNHLFTVLIPFADHIEWNDKENRRNGGQFFDIIKAFAVFDFMNRTHINDTTIEATEDDFKNALSLYSTRAVNQKLKLNDSEQKYLSQMIVGKKYTMPELQELFEVSQGTIYTLFHGRKDRNGGGLLSKVPSLISEKETEYLGDIEDSTKRSKSKVLYCLTKNFKNLISFESVAFLRRD